METRQLLVSRETRMGGGGRGTTVLIFPLSYKIVLGKLVWYFFFFWYFSSFLIQNLDNLVIIMSHPPPVTGELVVVALKAVSRMNKTSAAL